MALKEQVIAAAQELLAANPAGLTGEALTGQVAKQVKRQLPMAQVMAVMRERPQLFIEGEVGAGACASKQQRRSPLNHRLLRPIPLYPQFMSTGAAVT